MKAICPECKNQIDLTKTPEVKLDIVIECNHCGITLLITSISPAQEVITEIVDEGK